jgi:hypothetical protein
MEALIALIEAASARISDGAAAARAVRPDVLLAATGRGGLTAIKPQAPSFALD